MPLILPQSAEVAAWKAEQALQVESRMHEVERLEAELKRIDASLSLVVAKPGSEDEGLIPGYWHLRKEIPRAPDEYWPLVGEDGQSRREPGAWIIDSLNASDLWDGRVARDKKELKRKLREAKVRAKRLAAEQRADELASNVTTIRRLRSLKGMTKRTDLHGKPSRGSDGLKTPGEKP